jgi:tetratricopeptide (TPR) repeat protein
MSTRAEIETLLSYVLADEHRKVLDINGLEALPKERRIAALRALQDLGWIGNNGVEDLEESYPLTREGRRIVYDRPIVDTFDPVVQAHIAALKNADSNAPDARMWGLRKLVEIECELSNWDSALLYCFELRKVAEKAHDIEMMAFSQVSQGRAERAQNHWHEALESYLKALELYMESGDRKGVCAANRAMGTIYGSMGEHSSAIRCFETSLSLAKELGDLEAETKAEANLAVIYDLEGRFEESELAGKTCVTRFLEMGDLSSAVKASINLGVLNMSREKFDVAAEFFEKAISSGRQTKNKLALGAALVNAGYCYARTGNIGLSMRYTDEAVSIFKEPNDSNMLALAYRNYGHIEFRSSNYENGAEWFEKSLRSAKASEVKDTMAACLYEFGMSLIRASRDVKFAKKMLKRSSVIYADIGNTKRAREIDLRFSAA